MDGRVFASDTDMLSMYVPACVSADQRSNFIAFSLFEGQRPLAVGSCSRLFTDVEVVV